MKVARKARKVLQSLLLLMVQTEPHPTSMTSMTEFVDNQMKQQFHNILLKWSFAVSQTNGLTSGWIEGKQQQNIV